jgi:oligoendopeptidase F
LSHEKIWSIYQKHMKSYMWDAVEQSAWSQNRWLYIGHFRMFFYNYAYAWGILIANALREKLVKQWSFINEIEENYFKNSEARAPEEIFWSLWIDITKKSTWESWLKKIKNQLDQVKNLVDEHGRDVSA